MLPQEEKHESFHSYVLWCIMLHFTVAQYMFKWINKSQESTHYSKHSVKIISQKPKNTFVLTQLKWQWINNRSLKLTYITGINITLDFQHVKRNSKHVKIIRTKQKLQLQLIIKTKLISSNLNVTVLSYQMWFKYSKKLTSSWADESWCDLFPSSSSSESSSPDESPEPPRSFTSAKQMTIFNHTTEHI